MSHVSIKHGAGSPPCAATTSAITNNNLAPYELGYDTTNKKLYINLSGTATQIGNNGTITGVSVNGTSVATSGVANITSIPASIISGKVASATSADSATTATNVTYLNGAKTVQTDGYQLDNWGNQIHTSTNVENSWTLFAHDGTTRSAQMWFETGNAEFKGTVTAPTFSGNLSGNATSATTATSATSATSAASATIANKVTYLDGATVPDSQGHGYTIDAWGNWKHNSANSTHNFNLQDSNGVGKIFFYYDTGNAEFAGTIKSGGNTCLTTSDFTPTAINIIASTQNSTTTNPICTITNNSYTAGNVAYINVKCVTTMQLTGGTWWRIFRGLPKPHGQSGSTSDIGMTLNSCIHNSQDADLQCLSNAHMKWSTADSVRPADYYCHICIPSTVPAGAIIYVSGSYLIN